MPELPAPLQSLRARLATVPLARRLVFAARGAREGFQVARPAASGSTIPPWAFDTPEPTFPGLVSQACTDNQMRTRAYRIWGDRLRTRDVFFHRKQWEWFYICQALEESGVIRPGTRGIGFGVGEEPITAWLAANGCEVLATDYPGGENADGWSDTGQLARSLADLNKDGICPQDDFDRLVSFRPLDMRIIADDLGPFDFAWSSCAFEHLGSIEAGIDFLEDHLKVLQPGGVGVHTTELNIASTTETIDHEPTVLYRRSDLEAAVERLAPHATVKPLNFNLGDNPNDHYIAPHALANTQLRLQVGPLATTSFGLIIVKH